MYFIIVFMAFPSGNYDDIVDFETVSQTMKLLDFDDQDENLLKKMFEDINPESLVTIVDKFYDKLLSFDYPKSFFTDERKLALVKKKQKEYFIDFFTTEHNIDFFRKRVNLGAIHERIGLDNTWYLASYALFFNAFMEKLSKGGKVELEHVKSLSRLVLLDIGMVINSYISEREKIINAQATEVIELSSPVLKLTDKIIVIPLLGTIDSARAFQIMEKILNSIKESNAKIVIIDITGVPLIDTSTGANLVRTVKAIRLMGSDSILTGVRPMLAQTIVELGIDLKDIVTRSTLSDGFLEALNMLKTK